MCTVRSPQGHQLDLATKINLDFTPPWLSSGDHRLLGSSQFSLLLKGLWHSKHAKLLGRASGI